MAERFREIVTTIAHNLSPRNYAMSACTRDDKVIRHFRSATCRSERRG